MNILPGNMRFGAGQPVKRLEDQRLLTGKGQFIDDLSLIHISEPTRPY